MHRSSSTQIIPLPYKRPPEGPAFAARCELDLPSSSGVAWRSNGGPTRGHPARSYPYTLEIKLELAGPLVRLHLLGVFAQYADQESEVAGTLGASLQLLLGDSIELRQELVNSRHYSDASNIDPLNRVLGDGTSVETVGLAEIDGSLWRVDLFTVDIPNGLEVDRLKFKALSSPASFVLFDVFAETAAPHGCPFHSAGTGVPLAKIGSIVRVGDRVEFGKAVDLLNESILNATDLDDARGQALTFLAVVAAAMLEIGGSRSLLRGQLDMARALDRCSNVDQILDATRDRLEIVAGPLCKEATGPTDLMVDAALAFVDRNYAKQLTDSIVAQRLGLSTSHFRYLFRKATGQPFHKYLIAIRLERAREMLIQQPVPVGSVARAVGFAGLSHFSRAFTQRFNVSPTHVRRGAD